jgi:RNA polymerase sigma-70 factor (ECF subfamily)
MGDGPEGWDDWFDATAPALLLFARQWADSHADAEDVVQEAFVRFWRARRRGVGDPKAYLFACVKRAALDARRARLRRQRREAEAGSGAGRGGGPGEPLFDSPLERDEWRAGVESALARLPEAQREVLVLKVWGGLTFPQIGAALGVPPNTAASRHRYALLALRRQLAEEAVP